MNTAANRIGIAMLANKSGGGVNQGDLVIVDTANASAFTTTTEEGFTDGHIGVVVDAVIPDDEIGQVAFGIWVPKLKLDTAASIGDFIMHSGVAGQGTPHAAPKVDGDFAIALDDSDEPPALLFGAIYQGGAGGAPSDGKYVTTTSHGSLSDAVVIPGLAGSGDISGVGGAGTSEEYDSSTTGLSWSPSTPNTVDSNTTLKSHLYIKSTDSTERLGTKSWSPAGAFDARTKFMLDDEDQDNGSIGLVITSSSHSNRLLLMFSSDQASQRMYVAAYTYSGSYTARGSVWYMHGVNDMYLRITRDGSNNISWFWSSNGITWQRIATASFSLTVANIGFRSSDAAHKAFVDFLRTSV